ncbi:nitroreductase/quinone reductase family protein [Streptomyces flaveus]|uniref:nitroreductase/quinone reductase family protein n=1 Tax=Streptomyces flaveus TaxID=66370 RepID=UPI003570C3DE
MSATSRRRSHTSASSTRPSRWTRRSPGTPGEPRGATLLETIGRTSGLPRRTPLGGRRVGQEFWLLSEYGEKSQYIRNIKADPKVRVRVNGRWHHGTAHLLPEDDARARLKSLPRMNSAAVRAAT